MDLEQFKGTLSGKSPPAGLDPPLLALWHEARGDWKQAHEIVQEREDRSAAAVHAYLHRVEGDLSNAGYWYRRAGRKLPDVTLAAEWELLAAGFLEAVQK
jgi:hypothetical protein